MTPLQIGVTGGIGVGKSMVCRVFSALGAPVYDADTRAKWLTNHDPALRAAILNLLGPEAYTAGSDAQQPITYNRTWVASRVFANPTLLAQLNALIHPLVLADAQTWVHQQSNHPYVIREAALMRAAGDQNSLDQVIVVTAPINLRIARIRQRDPHRSETEIRSIIDRQLPDADRLLLANYVVHNDETELLLPQVVRLHEEFMGLSGSGFVTPYLGGRA
ncbi:MAG: dephospho-CoA kinase [Bacteroidetes bacterium]|nr:dephospho-CoA kinase [Fibrella sp.]